MELYLYDEILPLILLTNAFLFLGFPFPLFLQSISSLVSGKGQHRKNDEKQQQPIYIYIYIERERERERERDRYRFNGKEI